MKTNGSIQSDELFKARLAEGNTLIEVDRSTKRVKCLIKCPNGHLRKGTIRDLNTHKCRECHILKFGIKIRSKKETKKKYTKFLTILEKNNIQRTIPTKISSEKACKIIQCDPSVEWFQTVFCVQYPSYKEKEQSIVKIIRTINKLLHKLNLYRKKEIIVASAICFYFKIFYTGNKYRPSNQDIASLCHISHLSLHDLIRALLKGFGRDFQKHESIKKEDCENLLNDRQQEQTQKMEAFIASIKTLRQDPTLTLDDIAYKMHCSVATLCHWFKYLDGKRTKPKFCKVGSYQGTIHDQRQRSNDA